jgi:hypothetical protein
MSTSLGFAIIKKNNKMKQHKRIDDDHMNDEPFVGGHSLVRIHQNCDNYCVRLHHELCTDIDECHVHFDIDECAKQNRSAQFIAQLAKETLETKYETIAFYNRWRFCENNVVEMCLDAPGSEDNSKRVLFEMDLVNTTDGNEVFNRILALPWRVKREHNNNYIPFTDGNTTQSSTSMVDLLFPGKTTFLYHNNNTFDLRRKMIKYQYIYMNEQNDDDDDIDNGDDNKITRPMIVDITKRRPKFRRISSKSSTNIPNVWEQSGSYTAFRIPFWDEEKKKNRMKYFGFTPSTKEQKRNKALEFSKQFPCRKKVSTKKTSSH